MIFSSNLLYCLHFINFCSTFSINLQSDIIYSPTLGTSADVPDVPCRTPLGVVPCGSCAVGGVVVWGSCIVRQLHCGGVAFWRSCIVGSCSAGELHCGGIALRGILGVGSCVVCVCVCVCVCVWVCVRACIWGSNVCLFTSLAPESLLICMISDLTQNLTTRVSSSSARRKRLVFAATRRIFSIIMSDNKAGYTPWVVCRLTLGFCSLKNKEVTGRLNDARSNEPTNRPTDTPSSWVVAHDEKQKQKLIQTTM